MITLGGSPAAGGGGGAGTVTSVTVQSDSLKNNSAPNPIVAAGTVELEVQIIDGTYVAIALLELGGALLEGVIYRITDFAHALNKGTITLSIAEFIAVKDKTGAVVLSTRGNAYSDEKYELSYSLKDDYITELYLPSFNQRATRVVNDASSNLEELPWEAAGSLNFIVDSTQITGYDSSLILADCVIRKCNVDQHATAFTIERSTLINNTMDLQGISISDSMIISSTVFVRDALSGSFIFGATVTVNTGFPVSGVRVGQGDQLDYVTSPSGGKTFESNLNELQLFTASNGGSDVVANSFATFIHCNIDAGAGIVGYTFSLPNIPIDGQVVIIGVTNAMATVVIDGNTHNISVSVAAFTKGQCIMYYYDTLTDTYYLG